MRGVLCVRGSITIKGYLNRPEATAETIVDGWLNTGDIARIDEDGFVYIVDRAKDMVIRGGENVYCSEVETAIYHHDAVAEAAVFGIPDERLGEEVAAVIVLKPGQAATEQEIRDFCRGKIAYFKVPQYVRFVDEFPMTVTKKVQKFVMLTGHMQSVLSVFVNEKVWQGIPAADRKILEDTMMEVGKKTLDWDRETAAKYRKDLEAKGMTFVEAKDGLDVEGFRKAVLAQVGKDFPEWSKLIEQIRAVK